MSQRRATRDQLATVKLSNERKIDFRRKTRVYLFNWFFIHSLFITEVVGLIIILLTHA
jgi:hypothetical protein